MLIPVSKHSVNVGIWKGCTPKSALACHCHSLDASHQNIRATVLPAIEL